RLWNHELPGLNNQFKSHEIITSSLGYCHQTDTRSGYSHQRRCGTMIIYPKGFEVHKQFIDKEGRFCGIIFSVSQFKKILLINIYAPLIEKEITEFWKKISQIIETNRSPDISVIIGGDFNAVNDLNMDRWN